MISIKIYNFFFLGITVLTLPVIGCTGLFAPKKSPAQVVNTTTATVSSTPIPKTLFGMHIQEPTKTPWPAVNVGALRVFVPWFFIQPNKGEWKFEILDKYVDLAEQQGVEVLYVFNDTPKWAAARPNEVGEWGKDFPGVASEPKDMEDWRNFVRTVATRYKGRIRAYQIWNETNNKNDYSGSIEKMVEMAQEAYKVLKEVDTNIIVVSPGAIAGLDLPGNESWISLGGVDWLDQYFAKGAAAYTDVVGPHLYSIKEKTPEERVQTIRRMQQVMAKHKLSHKPLWDTENAYAKFPNEQPFTDEEARGFIARTYIIYWASGISRFYWYAWDVNTQIHPNWLKMVQADNKTLTPASIAYSEVQKWLIGATMKSCQPDSNKIWICQVTRDNNYTGWIVWNPEGKLPFKVPSNWNIKQVRDLAGGKSTLPASGSVEIGRSPILLD